DAGGAPEGVPLEAAVTARAGDSALALLVTRVRADDHDARVATDHLAVVTDRLDARLDLHSFPSPGTITCSGTRCGPGRGRRGSARRPRGPREGCGCSAGASSRRCARAPCARCRARPGSARSRAPP